jgi:nitrogen PTS system EIIA component
MVTATGFPDDGFPFPLIDIPSSATSPEGVIRFLLADVVASGRLPNDHVEDVVSRILRREELGSTGLGRGLAVPHIATEAVKQVVIATGRLGSPVNWKSADGEPVHIVCLLIAPGNGSAAAIRHLETVVRHLRGEKPDRSDDGI